jgi:hypothetical protein
MEEIIHLTDTTSFSMVDVVLLPQKVRTLILWLIHQGVVAAEDIERETGLASETVADVLVRFQKMQILIPVDDVEGGRRYRVILTIRVGSYKKSNQSDIWNSVL